MHYASNRFAVPHWNATAYRRLPWHYDQTCVHPHKFYHISMKAIPRQETNARPSEFVRAAGQGVKKRSGSYLFEAADIVHGALEPQRDQHDSIIEGVMTAALQYQMHCPRPEHQLCPFSICHVATIAKIAQIYSQCHGLQGLAELQGTLDLVTPVKRCSCFTLFQVTALCSTPDLTASCTTWRLLWCACCKEGHGPTCADTCKSDGCHEAVTWRQPQKRRAPGARRRRTAAPSHWVYSRCGCPSPATVNPSSIQAMQHCLVVVPPCKPAMHPFRKSFIYLRNTL